MLRMDHADLVDYAESLGSLKDEIGTLNGKLDTLQGELTLIKNANVLLKQHSTKMESRVTVLEKELTRTSQYSLNRQLELHRVPVEIPQSELAGKVCDILSLTGAKSTHLKLINATG